MNPVRIHHISAFMLTPQYLKNHLQMKMNYFASMWLLHTRKHARAKKKKKKKNHNNNNFRKIPHSASYVLM
jgi:predicted SPOUT superfamily RNA methylase MTH1